MKIDEFSDYMNKNGYKPEYTRFNNKKDFLSKDKIFLLGFGLGCFITYRTLKYINNIKKEKENKNSKYWKNYKSEPLSVEYEIIE